jgi:Fe-S oxidoreductase
MLDTHDKDLERCAACHDQCLFATSEVFATGRQTLATSRKALLLIAASHGLMPWTLELSEVVYAGLGSGIQHAVCVYKGDPSGWPDESTYLRTARQELVRRGLAPPWATARLDLWRRTGDPYGNVASSKHSEGDVVFLLDAASRALQPRSGATWLGLARYFGIDAGVLRTGSSGFELADLGFETEAQEAAVRLANRLDELQTRLLVSDSPETVHMLKRVWPSWGIRVAVPIQHTSQWLLMQLRAGGTQIRPIGGRMTFHDPSYLVRHLGISKDPRDALTRLGVNLVEMLRSGEEAPPSGSFHGDAPGRWVATVSAERADSAKAAGAVAIVTASPFDFQNLRRHMRVIDLGRLALRRLRAHPGTAAGRP